jgi:hypothetical protein
VAPPERLREELSIMLVRVLSWTGDDYEVASGFKEMRQKYLTRDQVEHIKYPMPNMANENDLSNEGAT